MIWTLIILLSFCYKDKKSKYFILLFTGIAFSYIFIIAFGRTFTNNFAYTYEQPRYAYFPNIMFALAVVLFLKNSFSMNKFQKMLTITVFSGLCILNTNKIHNYNKIILQQLSPTKQYIDTIEKFISKVYETLYTPFC